MFVRTRLLFRWSQRDNHPRTEDISVMEFESRHQCLIYEGSPSQQLPTLVTTIRRKLDEGYRCMYLNSRPMVAGIRSHLAATGIDVVSEIAKARLVLSSEPSSATDDGFDVDLMLHKLEDALDQALDDGYSGLCATGDMTWEFGSQKNLVKLLDYERRLEELFHRRQELFGICQYHRDTLPLEAIRQGLLTPRTLFINETRTRVNPHDAPPGLSNDWMGNPELDEMITALCQLQRAAS